MSLPKELLNAVKKDKEMLKLKLEQLKESFSVGLSGVKKAIEEGPKKEDPKEETAFSSIIKQGKLAEEQVKIDAAVKTLQEQLITTSSSTSIEQKAAIQEQIDLLKGDKLDSLEAKQEAREMAEKSVNALESIAEGQTDLIKEFKSGFSELRGEGLGGLIKMLIIGIPALLGGIVTGIGAQITAVLSRFKTISLIFGKIGKFFGPILKILSGGAGAIGGFLKTLPMVGKFFASLFAYAGKMFTLGTGLAKLAGPIGITISVITGLIGGIKGAIRGFKEDGIIGMVREGIIGVFNGLIGGLVKMVGSMIGGIFKLLGFEQIGEAIKGGFSDFVDGIIGAFRGIFNILAGLFTLDFGMLKEGVGQLLDGIINIVWGAIKGLGGILVGLVAGIGKAVFALAKALFITLPIKLITFAAKMFKAIYFDLPVAAFKMIFNGIKFMFTELPGMLIDKVKSFFTSMVESIGDAFKTAFGFVKRIGKASRAALKAAIPGGESPKEAFMRVMGGDKGGEEKEEKENAEKIKEESSVEAISMPSEKIIPPAPKKETIEEFEARMMATVTSVKAPESAATVSTPESAATVSAKTPALGTVSATETGVQSFSSEGLSSDDDSAGPELEKPEEDNSLFGKIKGIGNMMKNIIGAPFKLLGKIKDSVLGMAGDGVDKLKGIAGGAAAGLKGIGEAGLGALKTFAGFTPPGLLAKGIGKLFGKKKKEEDGVEGAEGMTPVLSSKTSEINNTDQALKDAKREQFTGNMLSNLARDQQMTLRDFENQEEQYVNPIDQIEGEGIIRDNQYEAVRRDSEGRLLDPEFGEEMFISPEDLKYVDSVKNNPDFAFESDTRVKEILDRGMKKKFGVSDEDYTFDKRKDLIEERLQKEEDDNRAQARDAKATIQQIEDGTYNPKALTPAASIAAGPEAVKMPEKLSFIDIIKKASNFAKKAASFTPPGLLFKGISKVKGLISSKDDSPLQDIIDNLPKEAREKILQGVSASNLVSPEEREMIMQKMARSQSSTGRIAATKKFDLIAKTQIAKDTLSPISSTDGAQLTMAQKENAELKGESGKAIAAPIIAPSNINNSQSSVSNVTVAAPPHIDKTQSIFGTTQLAY